MYGKMLSLLIFYNYSSLLFFLLTITKLQFPKIFKCMKKFLNNLFIIVLLVKIQTRIVIKGGLGCSEMMLNVYNNEDILQ